MISRVHQFARRLYGIDAMLAREKSLVTRGAGASIGLMVRGMLRMLFGMGAMCTAIWVPDLRTLAYAVIGGLLGGSSMIGLVRAGAYRSGWLNGRTALIEEILATRRMDELTAALNHALTYDAVHVQGISPRVPDFFPGEDS